MKKTHRLKTVQPFFEKCWQQKKTFEVRKNDRQFQEGDTVILQEYDPETKIFSGKEIQGTILYVLNDFHAVEKGYVVFSFTVDHYFFSGEKLY